MSPEDIPQGQKLEDLLDWVGARIERAAYIFGWEFERYLLDSGQVVLFWEEPACGSGCCGWTPREKSFPYTYLTMPDEELFDIRSRRVA
jgi:hypothetical protein